MWRITTISVLTQDKIKMNDNRRENYNNINFNSGQDKIERQVKWRITSIVLTMDKIRLKDSQCGELQQYQF